MRVGFRHCHALPENCQFSKTFPYILHGSCCCFVDYHLKFAYRTSSDITGLKNTAQPHHKVQPLEPHPKHSGDPHACLPKLTKFNRAPIIHTAPHTDITTATSQTQHSQAPSTSTPKHRPYSDLELAQRKRMTTQRTLSTHPASHHLSSLRRPLRHHSSLHTTLPTR